MSGISARESYRSGKRTRPSDSQPSRMTPPVLFRLPSVAMPTQEPASASNMNSVAVSSAASSGASSAAMAASATVAVGPTSTASVVVAPSAATPSAPVQTAVATIAAEKASGQRLLNMLIIALLIAALAVIAWVSLNRPTTSPTMAKKTGNDSALDTLGELKVPEVTSGTIAEASKPPTPAPNSGLNVDEIKPANPSDLSLIDLPDAQQNTTTSDKPKTGQPGSLLVGIDTSGTDNSLADTATNTSTSSSSTPTAQIQLRSPVPVGSNGTSLVDATRTNPQTGSLTLGSSSTPSVQTVSTPTQPSKVFPPNPAYSNSNSNNSSASGSTTTSSPSSSNSSGNTNSNSGNSPSLWDEANRPSLEGLQLSGKPSSGNGSTQVNISKPLSAEIAMPGAANTTNTADQPSTKDIVQHTGETTTPDAGVTVGGGEPAPYRLAKSRFDLDPVTLARIAASRTDKSAVSGTATPATQPTQPTQTPINSYAGANRPATPGQNLYENNYVQPAPGSTTPINSYARTVPPGVTGNGTTPYVPPTTPTPGAGQYVNNQYASQYTNPYPANQAGAAQYPAVPNQGVPSMSTPAQLTHGYNSVPASTAGYQVPARGMPMNYGPNATAPNNVGYAQPNYGQNYPQPNAQQPGIQPSANTQPTYVPSNYSQPGFAPGATAAPYGQTNSAYGNPAYPSPSMNMPAGYQSGASYPTKSPYPGGQVPTGMIGPSGNATQPTSDVAPVPVMGRGGAGTSTPYGAPQ